MTPTSSTMSAETSPAPLGLGPADSASIQVNQLMEPFLVSKFRCAKPAAAERILSQTGSFPPKMLHSVLTQH